MNTLKISHIKRCTLKYLFPLIFTTEIHIELLKQTFIKIKVLHIYGK